MIPAVKNVTTFVVRMKSTALRVACVLTDLTESTESAQGAPTRSFMTPIVKAVSALLALTWFSENVCPPAEETRLELKVIAHAHKDST